MKTKGVSVSVAHTYVKGPAFHVKKVTDHDEQGQPK